METNRGLKDVRLRNATSREANWWDHGRTPVQECTTTEKARHSLGGLWVNGRDLCKKTEGVRERMRSGMRGIRTRGEGGCLG